MAEPGRQGAQPARPGRRRGAQPDPGRGRRVHRARRPGEGPDGRHREGGRRLGRPAALPLRHQGTALRRRADLLPRGLGGPQRAGVARGRGPARRSASPRSSTDACPATSSWPTSGCSGRSWRCSASASRSWQRWAQSSTRTSTPPSPAIIADGIETGVFAPAIDSRKVAETAVALCDGLGARVVANDPHLTLDEARATIAATVGMLVGHDGPLPKPTSLLAGSHA